MNAEKFTNAFSDLLQEAFSLAQQDQHATLQPIHLLSVALQNDIIHFQESILPGSSTGAHQTSVGFFSGVAIVRTLPEKFEFFLKQARTIIMIGYPVLSLIPPFLSFSHYMIIKKLIKQVSKKQ